jgi:hypothetical protein
VSLQVDIFVIGMKGRRAGFGKARAKDCPMTFSYARMFN